MVVTYSIHAEQKLLTRRITREDVEIVIQNPNETFEDFEHDAKVAIGPLGERSLVVVYRMENSNTKVITAYHTRRIDKLVSSKIERGVWRRAR